MPQTAGFNMHLLWPLPCCGHSPFSNLNEMNYFSNLNFFNRLLKHFVFLAGGGHSPSSSVSSIEELEDGRPLTVRPMNTAQWDRSASAKALSPGNGNGEAAAKPARPPRPVPVKPIIHDMKAFLMQSGPKMGPIQCKIVREKGSTKMFPTYELMLDDGDQFLLSARKRKKVRCEPTTS